MSGPQRTAAIGRIDPSMLATMSNEEIAHTLRMDPKDFADFSETIAANPHSTIEPAQRSSADTQGRQALEGLGAQRGDRGITSGLDMERTIGEGGMGLVRLATQRSLGRKVAVKTLRPEARSDAATLRLLREAWVTGTLEHPNIVPVYDLGLDTDGSPIIILKRIEGVEWGVVIQNAALARERYGAEDLLEHNLRILISLCNAVGLAHARGVLHRDLKPENVMIGKFGEVYLVDWGIAVSLLPDPHGRLPLASEQTEVAGTPCYMAPEMLGATELGKLSELTDVYLLGSILHEILTGTPPHTGTFKQIVGSILLSTFVYDPQVPRELADIAQRAMSREPADRFGSAEELRKRLEWYLRHRGSLAISAEASRRLNDMRELVAMGGPPESIHDHLYHLHAECRFGFKQALKESPDNDTAREGLREAIEIVVRFELDRGAADAAAGALAEIADPPPELVERVREARKARAAEKQRMVKLERLDADRDPTVGRRTRVGVTTFLGLFFTIAPQASEWAVRHWPDQPHWTQYVWSSSGVVLGAAIVRWGRESLSKTAVSRHLISTGMIAFAMHLALRIGGHVLRVPVMTVTTMMLLMWAMAAAQYATSVDRRFWVPVASYLAGFFAVTAYPTLLWNAMSATNFVLTCTFVISWWRPAEDRPRFLQRREEMRRAKAAAQSQRPPPVS